MGQSAPAFLDPYVVIARTRPSVTAQAALSAAPRDPLFGLLACVLPATVDVVHCRLVAGDVLTYELPPNLGL
jgi:hypothetical protein